MKLHPRLLPSTVRSLFGRFSSSPRHTLAPRAPADGPLFPARDFDSSSITYKPSQNPALLEPLLFWIMGAGLAGIYFIWFFSDLLAHAVR